MQGVMRRLDHSGHTDLATWTEDPLTQEEADRRFKELIQGGDFIYGIVEGEPTQLTKFDPTVHEIIVHRNLVGG